MAWKNERHVNLLVFTYTRIGSMCIARLFGVPVYKTAGDNRWLCGLRWKAR